MKIEMSAGQSEQEFGSILNNCDDHPTITEASFSHDKTDR
jgi:hypothetical protein